MDIYTVAGRHYTICIYPGGCSVLQWLDNRRYHIAREHQDLTLAEAKHQVNQMIASARDAAARIETH